jgi:hypothetical protein
LPGGGAAGEPGDELSGSLRLVQHVLIGALDECALYVARAEDPEAARQECTAILDRILRGITPGG